MGIRISNLKLYIYGSHKIRMANLKLEFQIFKFGWHNDYFTSYKPELCSRHFGGDGPDPKPPIWKDSSAEVRHIFCLGT